jgi:hypothetical protein
LDHKPLMDSPMNEVIWIASYLSLKTTDMFMIDFLFDLGDKDMDAIPSI